MAGVTHGGFQKSLRRSLSTLVSVVFLFLFSIFLSGLTIARGDGPENVISSHVLCYLFGLGRQSTIGCARSLWT